MPGYVFCCRCFSPLRYGFSLFRRYTAFSAAAADYMPPLILLRQLVADDDDG